MTAPTSWLTLNAAATRLSCPIEGVQQMVDDDLLHGRWIHDHLSISEESVQARIVWADDLAEKYRTTAAFILRLSEYARRRRAGADAWDAALPLVDAGASAGRYERWFIQLGAELVPGVLAADLEDAMSAYLSQEAGLAPTLTPRAPDNPAERELTEDDETYREEQKK